jgi:sugar O-acyltransferase (sialic acid O-acetyltransferase NeuD family)
VTAGPVGILGAGGHAKVVIDIVERMNAHRIAGVFDDDPSKWGTHVLGHRVLGGIDDFLLNWRSRCAGAVLGIGNNRVRRILHRKLREAGFVPTTAVHPTAAVARDVEVGDGTVVMALAAVNPGCRIGPGTVINTSASVDHDCILGECVFIAPGARLGGNIRVGDLSLIGTGASIIPGRTVGRNAIVGAGAVVITDIPDDVTVVGVPAHVVAPAGRIPGGEER